MPVNLSQERDLLLPGLRAVTGEYDMIPTQWDKIFGKGTSNMALERTAQMRFLGLAQLKNEGAQTRFDNNAGERFVWNQEHMEIGLGYAITRKAIDDNLYKSQFRPANLGLQQSFAQTKEIYGANVLNTGNVYNPAVGGDGVSLFSTAHPIDGATFANTSSVPQSLNESSLLNVMTTVPVTFLDIAGLKIYARARKLVVPRRLEPVAIRLTQTELRPGTADNDVNAILSTAGGLPDGYVANDFLTSNFAWFVLTNIEGLLYLQRVAFEMDMFVEFTTDNLLVKGYERWSFNYNDPRAAWGEFPSA
jgi:hypothetical protein